MAPSYRATAWLQATSDFNLKMAEVHLQKYFSGAEFSGNEHSLKVTWKSWPIHLYLDEAPHVALEAQEIPSIYPECPRASEIALCRRRVDVVFPEPDPNGKHFNDFVHVCQAIEKFQGVILFDPDSGQLI